MCGDLKKWHEICQNKLEDDDQSITNYQQWQTNKESGCLQKAVLQGTVSEISDSIRMKLNYFLFHEYVKKCQSISFKEKGKS